MKNKTYVLFWIKSNRGTNDKGIFEIPKNFNKEDIKYHLEKWCSEFGAWKHSDNYVTYGYKYIKVPTKKELDSKYKKICIQKNRIIDKWKTLAAMYSIIKL